MNGTCRVDGCDAPVWVRARALCSTHYKRWRKYGDPTVMRKAYRLPERCAVTRCPLAPIAKGLCQNHYALARRNGAPVRVRVFTGVYLKDGYRYVRVGHRHYEPEHRLVMERVLGRKLKPSEHVHHVDGDTLNNSPSNLAVLSRSAHLKAHLGDRWRRPRGHYIKP